MILELKTELAVRETPEGTPVSSPEEAAGSLKLIERLAQECFCVLSLNSKNRLIAKHLVSLGTLNQSLVHPREVFRPAIMDSAASVILAHNHPSADPTPSAEDITITRKLIEAGRLIGIDVLDHLILAENGPFSMREAGLLDFKSKN